jgi:ubiquinone/menaquinone biosynthesis C-methylase UbiE
MAERKSGPSVKQWNEYWEKLAPTVCSAPVEVWKALTSELDLSGLIVLDIATGTGGTAVQIASQATQVATLDLSSQSLKMARHFGRQQGLTLYPVCGDALYLPFAAETFDLVISLSVMHYFHDPSFFLHEIGRVTKPGGQVLIEVPQKFSLFTLYKRWRMARHNWEYGEWETEYSVGHLERLLGQHGFRPVYRYGREYYPYLYYAARHLSKIEKHLGRRVASEQLWHFYEKLWQKMERGWWGLHTLRDIGVLARKI